MRTNQSILMMQGIAAISIVLYHSMGLYCAVIPMGSRCDLAVHYLGYLGLIIFSFFSGYKLTLNHRAELQDKTFLKRYLVNRFLRLYKPYIGYTLLVLPFLYVTIWLSRSVFNLDYPGLHFLDNPYKALLDFIIGANPVANQLWYLVMLLEVTFLCLIVLYIFDIDVLFRICFILLLLWPLIYNNLGSIGLYRITLHGMMFIIGMFFATRVILPRNINASVLKPLLTVGSYSFYIYLFQAPLLIAVPGRVLLNMLHITNILVPVFLTIFTIVMSIIIYKIIKKFGINRLIE